MLLSEDRSGRLSKLQSTNAPDFASKAGSSTSEGKTAKVRDFKFVNPLNEGRYFIESNIAKWIKVRIQMFLLTTALSQFVFVFTSNFDCPVGFMMVENIPYMLKLSNGIINELRSRNALANEAPACPPYPQERTSVRKGRIA
ncbi:unnamed protein product [Phytophthora lilii]|uniref:Unnamed protein product n=1 Tax=Phytophthora lilii TaxID=2077276 RepID=A0A9W7CNB0_9STRA|nr:unnamed protein product [Phytophthora lilii]